MIDLKQIYSYLQPAFEKAGVTTTVALQDDDKIRKASEIAYKAMPLPVRLAVNASIGRDGFEKLVFRAREKMVASGKIDMTGIEPD